MNTRRILQFSETGTVGSAVKRSMIKGKAG